MVNKNRNGINIAATINGETLVYPVLNDANLFNALCADGSIVTTVKHTIAKPEIPNSACKQVNEFFDSISECWLFDNDSAFDVAIRLVVNLNLINSLNHIMSYPFTPYTPCKFIETHHDANLTENTIHLIINTESNFKHEILLAASTDPKQIARIVKPICNLFSCNIKNPSIKFSANAKSGRYNNLSDDDYCAVLAIANRPSNDMWFDKQDSNAFDIALEIEKWLITMNCIENGFDNAFSQIAATIEYCVDIHENKTYDEPKKSE